MITSRPSFRSILHSRSARIAAFVQLCGQVSLGVPIAAQSAPSAARAAAPAPPPKVAVNRTVPRVPPPTSLPVFSGDPTDAEITRARVLDEALVPLAGTANAAENQALAGALLAYRRVNDPDAVQPFEAFLQRYPASRWEASLRADLGRVARRQGAFSKALVLWERAWQLAKDDPSASGALVASDAIGARLAFASDLGHVALLERALADVGDRTLRGRGAAELSRARASLDILRTHPDAVVACGRQALALLWRETTSRAVPAALTAAGAAALSLADLTAIGRQAGLDVRAVARPAGAAPVAPAVVHLTIGHYALLVRTDGERFLVRDPGLGAEIWMTRAAFDAETSGYALVPAGREPEGWRPVTGAEAAGVRGASYCPVARPHTGAPPPCPGAAGPGGGPPPGPSGPPPPCGSGCSGMPAYTLNPHNAALHLTDTPVGYAPPRGPAMFFTLRYDSRQVIQPDVRTYGHVGRQWTHDWLSYVYEIPAYCETGTSGTNYCFPARANVYLRGGGEEEFANPDASGVYPRHWRAQAQLVRVSTDPIRYERRLPDGSVDVYTLADTAPAGSRKIFLTEVRDATGQSATLTYDASYRLVALTDALGQVTTLTYADAADPLRLTQVTDPFGRSATVTYTAAGQIESLTDTLGLTSRLGYLGDLVVLLTTPYGPTSFRHGGDAYNPTVEATDALGATERVEYRWETTAWPATEPANEVPADLAAQNAELNQYTSVVWDKAAWAAGPGSPATATRTRWLLWAWSPYATPLSVNVPHSVKRPLERRVWYRYPGQATATRDDVVYDGAQPSMVARVLDDGTVQRTQATYNGLGQVTSRVDAAGRETTYTYAANGEDLLEVRQTRPGGSDLLAQYGSYTTLHQPQTITDAAGQTTTLTYNAAGQVLTTTNAKQEMTTYGYDGDGRLQSVTGPVTGATTTYTYDGYGRPWTVTGPDGYTVTTTYDLFDRPVRTTYPDGTYEETTYDRLDARTRRDRLGRVTQFVYDELRRLRATRDPAGRTVSRTWTAGGCAGCGSRDTLTDAKGQTTIWERDVQGRVMRELRADGVTATLYTYQPASGRLGTVTDPKGQVTTYAYAVDDSVIGTTFTNAPVVTPGVSYSYDSVYTRVATMVDGTGTTAYTYHPAGSLGAGQVATVDGPLTDDTIAYTYDELGRVVSRSINGAANTTTQGYDALGRVTTETNVLGTFSYAYVGATGRLQLVTYPNGQTSSYAYFDTLGDLRLQTIHHRKPDTSTLSKFDYTYDVAGNILTWQQQADSAAPTIWRYGYDRADQLTAAVHETTDPTPAIIKRYAYSYDPAGNRTSEQIDDAVTLATHDNLNRLLTHQPGGVLTFKGALNEPGTVTINGRPASVDAANRFVAGVPVTAGTNTITINAVDAAGNATEAVYEVDQAGTNKTFTYDANGNMTSDGTRTFEWDARNQLVAVNIGTHRLEFGYDGLQRRVREIEKENGVTQSDARVLWCGTLICEERTADGTTVTSRRASFGELASSTHRFLTADHLGSVRDVTDASGSVIAQYAFDPWGRRTVATGIDVTSVGYTGHQWQESVGTWQTLYRLYDPSLGRWLSADPQAIEDGTNRHAYAANRPISLVDPLGLYSRAACILTWTFAGATAGAAAGAAAGAGGGLVLAGIGALPGGAAGAGAGAAAGAASGILTGLIVCPPDGACPVQRSRPRFEPDDRCKKVKTTCIETCSEVLPTRDHGFGFWNCVNRCMADAGC